jgi:hypothetical protein
MYCETEEVNGFILFFCIVKFIVVFNLLNSSVASSIFVLFWSYIQYVVDIPIICDYLLFS